MSDHILLIDLGTNEKCHQSRESRPNDGQELSHHMPLSNYVARVIYWHHINHDCKCTLLLVQLRPVLSMQPNSFRQFWLQTCRDGQISTRSLSEGGWCLKSVFNNTHWGPSMVSPWQPLTLEPLHLLQPQKQSIKQELQQQEPKAFMQQSLDGLSSDDSKWDWRPAYKDEDTRINDDVDSKLFFLANSTCMCDSSFLNLCSCHTTICQPSIQWLYPSILSTLEAPTTCLNK